MFPIDAICNLKHLLSDASWVSHAKSAALHANKNIGRQTSNPPDTQMRQIIILTSLLMLSLAPSLQASETDDWTHYLNDPRFMPAIKSCLAAHPKGQGPAVVMNVWHANRDEAGVMTTDLSGRKNSCMARKDTGLERQSETVFDLPGPLFVSVDQVTTAPEGRCIESTPVFIDQQLQGWILRQPVLLENIPSACSSPIWSELSSVLPNRDQADLMSPVGRHTIKSPKP
ncbi:hypothetical protein [Pseudomonas fluorescens]|uniref:hypothetical protein n=1 Tax=Pseudomonas fluorescens TaxID=294 RepID=UPI001CD6399A|nr:hypothetical protein [Pseudomonas fluorescens]